MKFPEIDTHRLRLIQLNENNLSDLFEIYSDELTLKYWDSFSQKDISETHKLLDLIENRIKSGTGICWGIKLKDEGNPNSKIIGTISYNRYSENGLGVIGYILNRKFWNQGLMTEAATEFLKFGFDQLKLHRIEAQVTPGNNASEKLLLKLGFIREGLLREREFYKGVHQSLIIYGKLKTDN